MLEQDRVVECVRDEGLVIHFTRDRYDAYVRASEGRFGGFDVAHKHDHETRWRRGSIDETALKAEIERLDFSIEEEDETPFRNLADSGTDQDLTETTE